MNAWEHEKNAEFISKLSPHLFWDIDNSTIELEKHLSFLIGRVVMYGDFKDWKYLTSFVSKNELKEHAILIRDLYPVSLNVLSIYLDIDKQNFRCFNYLQSPHSFWK